MITHAGVEDPLTRLSMGVTWKLTLGVSEEVVSISRR